MSKAGSVAIGVSAKALKLALRGINAVVERRNTIPVLSNVLLTAGKDGLLLAGSDLDIQIERGIGASGAGNWATTVSAALLEGIAAKLSEGAILMLEPDGSKLKATSGRARFTLATLPADDFPKMVEIPLALRFEISPAALLKLIETTWFAVSTEETRYYLNGLYVHPSDAGRDLVAVATDGHRLARAIVAAPDDATEIPAGIWPTKCADVLRGLIEAAEDKDAPVELTLSKTKVRARIGQDTLVAKLIDGTFPEYTRVIPAANPHLLKLDRAAIAEAVDRVATIASEKTKIVKWSLGKDVVTLSVLSLEHGLASEEVPCDYAGPPLELGLNAAYTLSVLKRIEGDVVELALADAAAPTLWRASDDAPAVFVIMPARV